MITITVTGQYEDLEPLDLREGTDNRKKCSDLRISTLYSQTVVLCIVRHC